MHGCLVFRKIRSGFILAVFLKERNKEQWTNEPAKYSDVGRKFPRANLSITLVSLASSYPFFRSRISLVFFSPSKHISSHR